MTTSLEKERTSQKSDGEKIRDFQRKIYLKAKQEKSQRKSKLYRQGAFEVLVEKYGLIDPTKCYI